MMKLVECIPNFSCSKEKDEATYNALVETAKSVPGCTLFDAQTDGNHNRCVFTLIGSPEAIEEVAFQLTKVATERIDMNKHHGEHKRMGATDVIPFVPQMDVTVEEAVEMSKRVAQRIWDELKVPSFLYEDSATRPERRNLATCRKGEFEGMPEKLLQPEWAPDYGERKIHPTAGITGVVKAPDGSTASKAEEKGFDGGILTVIMGFDANGAETGIWVDASTQTKGIGSNVSTDDFLAQFNGMDGTKNIVMNQDFDAYSGATISSTALFAAINDCINCFNELA